MMFYVTKYAATKGIITIDPSVSDVDGDDTEICVEGKIYKFGKGLFTNLDDARKDAIKRTRRKITGLVKKEAKLEDQISVWESELPS